MALKYQTKTLTLPSYRAVTASIGAPIDDLAAMTASREAALTTAAPSAAAGAGGSSVTNAPVVTNYFDIQGDNAREIAAEVETVITRLFDSVQSGSYNYG